MKWRAASDRGQNLQGSRIRENSGGQLEADRISAWRFFLCVEYFPQHAMRILTLITQRAPHNLRHFALTRCRCQCAGLFQDFGALPSGVSLYLRVRQ